MKLQLRDARGRKYYYYFFEHISLWAGARFDSFFLPPVSYYSFFIPGGRDGIPFGLVGFSLTLADDGLGVVARDVVEHDAIVVEVVQDRDAELVAFAVIRLGSVGSGTKSTDNH